MNIDIEYLAEAQEYLDNLNDKARDKMFYNIGLVQSGVRDVKIFKKLIGTEIWEFRAEYRGNAYRLLSFWDKTKSSLVIATHGFDKKSQKTPQGEIAHAEKIMKEYYKTK